MPQDDIEDAGALDDTTDVEYKVPNMPLKKHDPDRYKRKVKPDLEVNGSTIRNNDMSIPAEETNEKPPFGEEAGLIGNQDHVADVDSSLMSLLEGPKGQAMTSKPGTQIPVCEVCL